MNTETVRKELPEGWERDGKNWMRRDKQAFVDNDEDVSEYVAWYGRKLRGYLGRWEHPVHAMLALNEDVPNGETAWREVIGIWLQEGRTAKGASRFTWFMRRVLAGGSSIPSPG